MNLPITLTVEKLKEIRGILSLSRSDYRISQSTFSKVIDRLADLDQWITELSPMEEPKEFGAMVEAEYKKEFRSRWIHIGGGQWFSEATQSNCAYRSLINPTPYKKEGA